MSSISLRTLLILLFSIAIILSVSITAVTFTVPMNRQSKERILQDDMYLVSQLGKSSEYVADTADNFSSTIAFDREIQSILVKYAYTENDIPLEKVRLEINQALSQKGMFNRAFLKCENIILFANDGIVLGSKESYDQNVNMFSFPWAEEVSESRGKNIWIPLSSDKNSIVTRSDLYIPVVRRVFSVPSSNSSFEESLTVGMPIGYLLVYFDKSIFSEIVSSYTSSDRNLFLVDENGVICSADDDSLIGEKFVFSESGEGYISAIGGEYLKTEYEVENRNGWTYICLTNKDEVEREKLMILLLSTLLGVFQLFAFAVIGALLGKLFSKPVKLLNESFVKASDANIRISDHSKISEFNKLYDSFNATVERIYDMADKIYLQQLEKKELAISIKESRIQSLQNQINPHFLYNTLDSINWQAQINGDIKVAEMVCTLGKFFRSNIRISENEIPITMELENARLFVELSKYRFGDKLNYIENCDDSLHSRPILRLLLQPLIENSIKHALEETGDPLTVCVNIEGDELLTKITVSDDGKGMDKETLSYLYSLWLDSGKEYHKETRSIGLYNVFRRLRLTYFENVELDIWSIEGEGTRFTITIWNNRNKSEINRIVE